MVGTTPRAVKKWTVKVWGNVMEQLTVVITMSRGWFPLIFPFS